MRVWSSDRICDQLMAPRDIALVLNLMDVSDILRRTAWWSLVTPSRVKGSDTVADTFVEGERTGEYVMHTWHSAWMMRRGETCVGDIIFRAVVKEGVFYLQFVGSEYME